VFIALYWVARGGRRRALLGWTDLTAPDPWYILPVTRITDPRSS
jgi:membrane protein insertase Oxa1/YidC/SpoIIIJ